MISSLIDARHVNAIQAGNSALDGRIWRTHNVRRCSTGVVVQAIHRSVSPSATAGITYSHRSTLAGSGNVRTPCVVATKNPNARKHTCISAALRLNVGPIGCPDAASRLRVRVAAIGTYTPTRNAYSHAAASSGISRSQSSVCGLVTRTSYLSANLV